MRFYSNTQIDQLNLKNFGDSYLPQSFDHSKPPLTGWRAERKFAEMAHQKSKLEMNRKPTVTGIVAKVIQHTKGIIIWVNGRAFN